MSALKSYNVQINSSKGAIVSTETNNTALKFLYECSDCNLITELTVNITVVNIVGLHSDPTVKSIVIQSMWIMHVHIHNHI